MSQGFDHHPQVLEAGWHGGQLFLLLLRISRRFRLEGRISPKFQGAEFLRGYWGAPPDFPFDDAKRKVVSSGLCRFETGDLVIDGWERWNDRDNSTERVRRFREKKRGETVPVTKKPQRRGEERRVEEIKTQVADATPPPPKPQEVVFKSWRETLGKGQMPMGKEDFAIIGARLKEFTVEQLCKVPLGARLDARRWPERAAQDEIKILFGTTSQVRKFLSLVEQSAPSTPSVAAPPPAPIQMPQGAQWRAVYQKLIDKGIGESYQRVLSRLEQVSNGVELRLRAPDLFMQDWVNDNLRAAIEEAAGKPLTWEAPK